MKLELKRIEPLRAANIGALVYGLLLTAFSILFFPFFLLMGVLASSEGAIPAMLGGMFLLVVYPVMGLVIGWIAGFLTCVIYNFVIRWTGGALLEFDNVTPDSTGVVAGPPA